MKNCPSDMRNLNRVLVIICLAMLLFGQDSTYSATFSPNTCGDGRVDSVLEHFDSTDFDIVKPDQSIPEPILENVVGCDGQALSVSYDLNQISPGGQSWIVLKKEIPDTNLSDFTHLRLALRGSNEESHENVEVKLWVSDQLHAVQLRSMTDLPVWRPIYIDLRELTNSDLSTISGFEIAVVRCLNANCEIPSEHEGTLFLDEFALVDLKYGATNRLVQTGFESVQPNWTVADKAADALHNMITPSGDATDMVPAWFPESPANYNTYAQAEALLVFIYEYERTGSDNYRQAADNLAKKLLTLQIAEEKKNAGAWHTAYYDEDLQPPTGCDGEEEVIQDIDRCEWVGNVGWVLIALGRLQQSGFYDDPIALNVAIDRGAEWLINQIGRETEYPTVISRGVEGNISAYFGLLASGRRQEAEQLGQAIFQLGWNSVQRRMNTGVGPADTVTAMDVSGSWGAEFLCSIGKKQEALDSQGYAATVLRTSSFDGSTLGYGDIAGPFTVAVEFAAQAAVAGIKDADFVMNQIFPLQIADEPYAGAFPGATDDWYGGSLPPWNTTMTGVSPTAWVYFASTFVDPLGGACRSTTFLPVILE